MDWLVTVVCWAPESLSARRAWIEIPMTPFRQEPATVALRKESVDRNAYGRINDISRLVALRKESVDRNASQIHSVGETISRSPQGERG